MGKELFIVAIALIVSLGPALAQGVPCDEAAMAIMKSEINSIKNAKLRKLAVSEIKGAEDHLRKHNVAACLSHLDNAMKYMAAM